MKRGALAGVRVLELGSGVSAAYCGKLLADMGADVVKLEPLGGDETRGRGPFPEGRVDRDSSGLYFYLNANKRGGVADLASAADRDLVDRLLAQSDVLVHNLFPDDLPAAGLDPARLRERHPRLVATSITPFGVEGPNRSYRATDLTLWNAGGVATLNGAGPGGEDLPPLQTYGPQASFQAGVNAAVATLGALRARRTTGRGQSVDVSVQECLVAILEFTFQFWPYCNMEASRLGVKPIQPLDFYQCKDGWVFICIVEDHQWRSLLASLGNPEWGTMDIFGDRLSRGANYDVLKPLLQEAVAEREVREFYLDLQARRVPIAPVSTMTDLLEAPHLEARGFFVPTKDGQGRTWKVPGAPYHFTKTPWSLRSPAPRLGEHDATIRSNGWEVRS